MPFGNYISIYIKDIPKNEINMAANRDYSCDELQF